nr:hypothetical protein [Candidatus Sigynarchaeota archaeon]
MDENKRKVLLDIGYMIRQACWWCRHGRFTMLSSDWGTCKIHHYDHLKHTGDARELSICRQGWCSKFEEDQSALVKLEKFVEFVEKEMPSKQP